MKTYKLRKVYKMENFPTNKFLYLLEVKPENCHFLHLPLNIIEIKIIINILRNKIL